MLSTEFLRQLEALQQPPAPFTPGEPLFWDDPHISQQMLAFHLDPNTEAASRRPEIIDRSVAWIADTLALRPGDAVLDLGCGPGLYTSRMARRGLTVTGVDYSRRSIAYATQQAREQGLDITYRYQNYLTLTDSAQYKAILLVYGDFCPLSPEQRARLLANVRRALKPGGWFVLDVTTRAHREKHGVRKGWYVANSGFWRPGLHLVLEHGFDYPEQALWLDEYIVIDHADEEPCRVTIYRNWFQDYTPETIRAELEAGGFSVQSLCADLWGTPYADGSEWLGIIARRV